eukprot:TRINITY_DN1882_c0_g1_i1.p1 TRINITY_DN1882_c0_g1~~TRINITY_DN1882_c0_g1_i1.p1  ORF type:complete len:1991 (-),score=395.70 TRINITY_DN1882_c0_g1_i1:104-5722(-)
MNIRELIMDIVFDFYVPLRSNIAPIVVPLIAALLPGIEDETAECYSRCLNLLDALRSSAGDDLIISAVWRSLASISTTRLSAVIYLVHCAKERPLTEFNVAPTLVAEGLVNGLATQNTYVVREVLDLMINYFPIVTPHMAAIHKRRMLTNVLNILPLHDLSLTRRVWTYLLDSSQNLKVDEQAEFFKTQVFELCLLSLDDLFQFSCSTIGLPDISDQKYVGELKNRLMYPLHVFRAFLQKPPLDLILLPYLIGRVLKFAKFIRIEGTAKRIPKDVVKLALNNIRRSLQAIKPDLFWELITSEFNVLFSSGKIQELIDYTIILREHVYMLNLYEYVESLEGNTVSLNGFVMFLTKILSICSEYLSSEEYRQKIIVECSALLFSLFEVLVPQSNELMRFANRFDEDRELDKQKIDQFFGSPIFLTYNLDSVETFNEEVQKPIESVLCQYKDPNIVMLTPAESIFKTIKTIAEEVLRFANIVFKSIFELLDEHILPNSSKKYWDPLEDPAPLLMLRAVSQSYRFVSVKSAYLLLFYNPKRLVYVEETPELIHCLTEIGYRCTDPSISLHCMNEVLLIASNVQNIGLPLCCYEAVHSRNNFSASQEFLHCIWDLLTPQFMQHHTAAALIGLGLSCLHRSQASKLFAGYLADGAENNTTDALQRYTTLWSVAASRSDFISAPPFIGKQLFIALEMLDSNNPQLKQLAQMWILNNFPYFDKLIYPVLLELMDSQSITVDGYFISKFETKKVALIFRILKAIVEVDTVALCQVLLPNHNERLSQGLALFNASTTNLNNLAGNDGIISHTHSPGLADSVIVFDESLKNKYFTLKEKESEENIGFTPEAIIPSDYLRLIVCLAMHYIEGKAPLDAEDDDAFMRGFEETKQTALEVLKSLCHLMPERFIINEILCQIRAHVLLLLFRSIEKHNFVLQTQCLSLYDVLLRRTFIAGYSIDSEMEKEETSEISFLVKTLLNGIDIAANESLIATLGPFLQTVDGILTKVTDGLPLFAREISKVLVKHVMRIHDDLDSILISEQMVMLLESLRKIYHHVFILSQRDEEKARQAYESNARRKQGDLSLVETIFAPITYVASMFADIFTQQTTMDGYVPPPAVGARNELLHMIVPLFSTIVDANNFINKKLNLVAVSSQFTHSTYDTLLRTIRLMVQSFVQRPVILVRCLLELWILYPSKTKQGFYPKPREFDFRSIEQFQVILEYNKQFLEPLSSKQKGILELIFWNFDIEIEIIEAITSVLAQLPLLPFTDCITHETALLHFTAHYIHYLEANRTLNNKKLSEAMLKLFETFFSFSRSTSAFIIAFELFCEYCYVCFPLSQLELERVFNQGGLETDDEYVQSDDDDSKSNLFDEHSQSASDFNSILGKGSVLTFYDRKMWFNFIQKLPPILVVIIEGNKPWWRHEGHMLSKQIPPEDANVRDIMKPFVKTELDQRKTHIDEDYLFSSSHLKDFSDKICFVLARRIPPLLLHTSLVPFNKQPGFLKPLVDVALSMARKNRVASTVFLSSLTVGPSQWSKLYKSYCFNQFTEGSFFDKSSSGLKAWSKLVHRFSSVSVSEDGYERKDYLSEIIPNLYTIGGLFGSFSTKFSSVADNTLKTGELQRIGFILLSSPQDFFVESLPLIFDKLNNGFKSKSPSVLAALFLCLRCFFLSFSPKYLAAFWARIFSETLHLLEEISENVGHSSSNNPLILVSLLKFIDLLLTLDIPEFSSFDTLLASDPLLQMENVAAKAFLDQICSKRNWVICRMFKVDFALMSSPVIKTSLSEIVESPNEHIQTFLQNIGVHNYIAQSTTITYDFEILLKSTNDDFLINLSLYDDSIKKENFVHQNDTSVCQEVSLLQLDWHLEEFIEDLELIRTPSKVVPR